MRVWFKSFMSLESKEHPNITRANAKYFADEVLLWNEESRIINITETLQSWGTVVTVWYSSDVEMI